MIVEVVASEKIKATEATHDAEVKSDEAAKAENEKFPQVFAKKTNVEQVTEAPQRAPLDETQRVLAKAAPEGSIARAVRLELERVWFEKEARRKFLRARAQSPHLLRDHGD